MWGRFLKVETIYHALIGYGYSRFYWNGLGTVSKTFHVQTGTKSYFGPTDLERTKKNSGTHLCNFFFFSLFIGLKSLLVSQTFQTFHSHVIFSSMYFNLPVDHPQQPKRPASEPWDSSKWTEQPVVPTPNMTNIRDESFSSILANLNEHKCTSTSMSTLFRIHCLMFILFHSISSLSHA